jgi:hypothetical protein
MIVKLSRLCNKGCGWVEGARMGEASPHWLTKVQIDTRTHNYATNAPKIQQPLLVKDEGAKQGC